MRPAALLITMIEQILKPSVLFDGACPVCAREIAFYRRRAGAESLHWIDISADAAGAQVCGIDIQSARERFHVVMPGGEPRIGAAAFVEIWRHLPAFRLPAVLFGHKPGIWLLDKAYLAFLQIRPWLQRAARR